MKNQTQYKYEYYEDILLKSNDGRKWFYFINKKDGKPIYSDDEKRLLEREREMYQEAQERWTEAYIEMLNDPNYWENQLHQYEEFVDQIQKEKKEEVSELSAFPIDALPYAVKDIVKAGQEAFDVGYEFFALPALVACASAIGSKFEVAINDTLSTKPIIYGCLIAMPGSGKSPAQNIVMKPLKQMQKQALKRYYDESLSYENEIEVYETKMKQAKKDSIDFTDKKPKKPSLQEYYTTNSTIEAIAKILQRSPKGIVYINDEFLAFYNSLNSYRSGKGSDLQEWLSLWNGTELKINRKGDDIPLIISDPYVSVVGNMTPSGIREIAKDSNTENGFLDRFLFSFPTDSKPFDPAKANGINKEVESRYSKLIQSLFEMETNEDTKYIKLSEGAMNSYKKYFKKTNEIAGEDEKLRSIVAKLQMYSLRFALIIHLSEKQNPNVDSTFQETIQQESMEKAILLCEYFRLQADKIYDKLAKSENDELLEKVVKVIKNKATKDGGQYVISKRDLQRGIKLKAEQMNGLIADLQEKEILKVKEEGKRGSITYIIKDDLM